MRRRGMPCRCVPVIPKAALAICEIPIMNKWIACLVLWAFSATPLLAECKSPSDDFNGLICLGDLYKKEDAELNAAYSKLVSALDPQDRSRVRKHQLDWIRLRDGQCGLQNAHQQLFDMYCAIGITKERRLQLQALHASCEASGCLGDDREAEERIGVRQTFLQGLVGAINAQDKKRFMQHMRRAYLAEQFYNFFEGKLDEFLQYSIFCGYDPATGKPECVPFEQITRAELISQEVHPYGPSWREVRFLIHRGDGSIEISLNMETDLDIGLGVSAGFG